MNYQDQYNAKLRSIEDVLSVINDGDIIHGGYCANTPTGVFHQLHKIADRVEHLTIYTDSDPARYAYAQMEELKDRWRVGSDFYSSAARALQGRFPEMLDYYPGDISRITKKYIDNGLGPGIVILCVSPMDRHGFFHHSMSCVKEPRILKSAKTVIVEVNRSMPVVYGDTALHISEVDYICECDHNLVMKPDIELTETEKTIGGYVAELVYDRDTIQIGLGGIPNAVCEALKVKHDLGIHTEMFGNGLMSLYESGAVTNKYTAVAPKKILASFILGTSELYEFVDRHPALYLGDSERVVAASVMARNPSMVSINTAIEVDITGQVSSESIGAVQFSGTGGATETAEGATHSPNGRSIICLRSTALKGTKSTIRIGFDPGTIVSIQRNTPDYIVTEYGIAVMRGCSVRQRAENLIAIAHPDFRAELRNGARDLI